MSCSLMIRFQSFNELCFCGVTLASALESLSSSHIGGTGWPEQSEVA